MSEVNFEPVTWVTVAKVMPTNADSFKNGGENKKTADKKAEAEKDAVGANLVVVIHRADENDPSDKSDGYEISGPASVQYLSGTPLVRLIFHKEDGRNAEVFLLPVDSPFEVKPRKVKGKRSGKKAVEIHIIFAKDCIEGYDEFVLTIPMDHDDGASAKDMTAALEDAATRVKKATEIKAAATAAAAATNLGSNTTLNNSTTSEVSDAMVIDQVGSPPTVLLSPIPPMKSPGPTSLVKAFPTNPTMPSPFRSLFQR